MCAQCIVGNLTALCKLLDTGRWIGSGGIWACSNLLPEDETSLGALGQGVEITVLQNEWSVVALRCQGT